MTALVSSRKSQNICPFQILFENKPGEERIRWERHPKQSSDLSDSDSSQQSTAFVRTQGKVKRKLCSERDGEGEEEQEEEEEDEDDDDDDEKNNGIEKLQS
ncbi:hypothetical protein RUM44_012585 [Polyplax serrata]|uniref:Uncharacterized protein n=1 Tax=Polyplax serrata TaxID=468196 RepID=A0ABR1BFY2_POLSC